MGMFNIVYTFGKLLEIHISVWKTLAACEAKIKPAGDCVAQVTGT